MLICQYRCFMRLWNVSVKERCQSHSGSHWQLGLHFHKLSVQWNTISILKDLERFGCVLCFTDVSRSGCDFATRHFQGRGMWRATIYSAEFFVPWSEVMKCWDSRTVLGGWIRRWNSHDIIMCVWLLVPYIFWEMGDVHCHLILTYCFVLLESSFWVVLPRKLTWQ